MQSKTSAIELIFNFFGVCLHRWRGGEVATRRVVHLDWDGMESTESVQVMTCEVCGKKKARVL